MALSHRYLHSEPAAPRPMISLSHWSQRWLQALHRGSRSPPPLDMDERVFQDSALTEAVRRLAAAYQPERIYLFGSRAPGDSGPDSDYDLLLVVPDDASPERRSSRLAYEVLRGTGTAADVLVCTHSYFENRRFPKASLPGTVLREGRVLHGV